MKIISINKFFTKNILSRLCSALLLAAITMSFPVLSSNMKLEIIDLKYRSANEVVPLIKPFVSKRGTVTGNNYKLIIRTSPDNLAQIKKILRDIDKAPRRLLISVRQDNSRYSTQHEAEISGDIRINKYATVKKRDSGSRGAIISGGDGKSHAHARIYSTENRDKDLNTQKLQVIEGRPAYINVGTSVPLANRSLGAYGGVQDSITYRDVTTGFDVIARVRDNNMVLLEISPHSDSLSRQGGGQINTQSLHTTITGRMGEWIELGGVYDNRSAQEGGTLRTTKRKGLQLHNIFLKVDELER